LLDVRTDKDIAGAFAATASLKVDALSVGIDALTQSQAETSSATPPSTNC